MSDRPTPLLIHTACDTSLPLLSFAPMRIGMETEQEPEPEPKRTKLSVELTAAGFAQHILVGKSNSGLCACDVLFVQEIFVLKQYRNRNGYGTALLRHIITLPQNSAAERVHLLVSKSNAHALEWYTKIGMLVATDDEMLPLRHFGHVPTEKLYLIAPRDLMESMLNQRVNQQLEHRDYTSRGTFVLDNMLVFKKFRDELRSTYDAASNELMKNDTQYTMLFVHL